MMVRNGIRTLGLSVLVLATACTPKVSDTGYIGTWTRGNGISGSTISISKAGDQYRFYWKLTSVDGKWSVSCDASAHCEEVFEGKKAADYRFSTRVDPSTGHLLVEAAKRTFDKDGKVTAEGVDLDELILEDGGLKLAAYTIERNGVKTPLSEAPQRHFSKLSDAVTEPGS